MCFASPVPSHLGSLIFASSSFLEKTMLPFLNMMSCNCQFLNTMKEINPTILMSRHITIHMWRCGARNGRHAISVGGAVEAAVLPERPDTQHYWHWLSISDWGSCTTPDLYSFYVLLSLRSLSLPLPFSLPPFESFAPPPLPLLPCPALLQLQNHNSSRVMWVATGCVYGDEEPLFLRCPNMIPWLFFAPFL